VAALSATESTDDFHVLAGVGEFEELIGTSRKTELNPGVKSLLDKAVDDRRSVYEDGRLVLFSETRANTEDDGLLPMKTTR